MKSVNVMAEDVFFLSKIMKAKYLDYDYVAMMKDLSKTLALKESIALENLNDKGLVFEDFTGDIEVEDLGKELFVPVFFGEFVSEWIIEDHNSFKKLKFHVLDGKYIQVDIHKDNMDVEVIEKEDILNYLPFVDELDASAIHPIDYFEGVFVDGMMVLKNQRMNKSSTCIQLVNDNGVFYQAKNNKIYSLTKAELKNLITKVLWED